MSLSKYVIDNTRNILSAISCDENETLNNALRFLAKWRSTIIQNTIVSKHGVVVQGGPFAGMTFLDQSAEGCHVPKLLGCYEEPLHKYFTSSYLSKYSKILNIGSAEGYYAVGIAKKVHGISIDAYDIDTNAQKSCKKLAEINEVEEQVNIFGEFNPEAFDKHSTGECLILCDIEGGEEKLLDVDAFPSLKNLDVIVESHECLVPGITSELVRRFSDTHQITEIADVGTRSINNPPRWFSQLSHLDQILAVWEWRSGPTPWLHMRALKGGTDEVE